MVQIKGSAIKETIEQIKSRAGEAAFLKILGLLDEETRKVCEGEIFSSTWYPLDLFTRFLEIEIKVLANGNEEMVTRGSEAVIERQLQGIYKAFVKFGSPEFVIKRIAAVHATYFQGVPIEVQLPENGPMPWSSTRALKNSTASWDSRLSDSSKKPSKYPAPRM